MLGLPVEEAKGPLEGALGDEAEDEYAGIDPEKLALIEILQGKRAYIPPGLKAP